MSSEILAVLEYMEKEKGISREDMIETISTAIKSAAAKGEDEGPEIKVEISSKTGTLQAWTLLEVVDFVSDPASQILLDKARLYADDPKIGDTVERELEPSYLGRIAAKTAEQAIKQRLRQFEKEIIYDEFRDQVGNLVTGIVRRRERGDLIVEVGKAEAVLPHRERVPGEDYVPGERIRCLLLNIDTASRGPELVLSRSSIRFVHRLFEVEITEIADNTVVIAAMAREPGYRTKVCVRSNDVKVDPVGACVGARGARVKSIVRELGGEKVDIIRHHEDPNELLHEALKPAVPKNVRLDKEARRIYFEVAEDDMAIAIGRRGQNARLTSRLLGWRLDIEKEEKKEVGFDQRMAKAEAGLAQIGLEEGLATRLVGIGLISAEAFEGVNPSDLVDAGFSEEEAAGVLSQVAAFNESQG